MLDLHQEGDYLEAKESVAVPEGLAVRGALMVAMVAGAM